MKTKHDVTFSIKPAGGVTFSIKPVGGVTFSIKLEAGVISSARPEGERHSPVSQRGVILAPSGQKLELQQTIIEARWGRNHVVPCSGEEQRSKQFITGSHCFYSKLG